MAEQIKETGDLKGMAPIRPLPSGSSRLNIGQTERIASAATGALLTTFGARRGSWLLATLGGYLVYRGASGYCPVNQLIGRNTAERPEAGALEISRSVTVNRPRAEVYRFWRQHENLPLFMKHLKEVRQIDEKRSHWVAQLADNKLAAALGSVEWDAEILDEEENSRIVWRSVPGAVVDHAGEVRFLDAPGGRGTEVHATIRYAPPAGDLGATVAKLFQPAFRQMVKEDIRRLKRYLETGSIPVNDGPSGRQDDETRNPALYAQQPTATSNPRPYESAVL